MAFGGVELLFDQAKEADAFQPGLDPATQLFKLLAKIPYIVFLFFVALLLGTCCPTLDGHKALWLL